MNVLTTEKLYTMSDTAGSEMSPLKVVVAGANGDLGHRIIQYLVLRKASVTALVRKGSASPLIEGFRAKGVTVAAVDYYNLHELTAACLGAGCVVSALSGLADVIVGVQSNLLEAAIAANVPRFIPSDFSIDYTRLPIGSNRNLDLRREFSMVLDKAAIKATTIFNGMFSDLLTGQAPVIIPGIKRVVFWGDADQPLDFTTIDNTAAYTAFAALDPSTPRYLRIAGEVASARGLLSAADEATGKHFKLLRVGGLGAFAGMIRLTRFLVPQPKEVFPPWQGMQYLHNMFTGLPKLLPLDTARYPEIEWTPVRQVLKTAYNQL